MISPQHRIIGEDIQKILIGASVAGVGAFLTYALEMLPNVDYGSYTPVVVALLSVIANIVRKYFTTTKY